MRICKVISLFVVLKGLESGKFFFAYLGTLFQDFQTWEGLGRELEAVIKSAASAASRKTRSRGPRSREAPRPAAVRMPTRRLDAPLQIPKETTLAAN